MNEPEVLTLFAPSSVWRRRRNCSPSASRRSVVRAQAGGTLLPVLRAIHRLAGTNLTFEGKAMAALIHCGPASFLDGYTAGVVHGLREMPRQRIVITATERVRAALPRWIRASTTSWFGGDDVVDIGPLRVAGPLRMMVRIAATSTAYRLERAAEDAWRRGLATPADMAAYPDLVRGPGREGVAKLDRWLRSVGDRQRTAQSGLELDAIEAVRLAGLPQPVRQHPIRLNTGEVIHLDFAWPDRKLAVEPGHSW